MALERSSERRSGARVRERERERGRRSGAREREREEDSQCMLIADAA
jgi:hypothetical protein